MKRKPFLLLFQILCLFVLLSAFAQTPDTLVNINRLYIQPDKVHPKIILETDSLLPIARTYYSPEFPSMIVVELERTQTTKEALIPTDESSLIKNIRIEPTEAGRSRLLIRLSEQIPYRIIPHEKQLIIELNKIQRTQADYSIPPEARTALEKNAGRENFLNHIDISEKAEGVAVSARLTNRSIHTVFALQNPPRLVVDLLGTTYSRSSSLHPVNKAGVEKVRVAQFQMSNPCPITRIVFDLEKPGLYDIRTDDGGMTVLFFENSAPPAITTSVSNKEIPLIKDPEPPIREGDSGRPEEVKTKKDPLKTPPAETEKESPPPKPATSSSDSSREPEKPAAPQTPPVKNQAQEEQFKPRIITSPEEQYTGEIISLKFKDADLRDVILFLGEFAGLNVVFDPDVRGIVTCNLEDVPWDQALDVILRINKMGMVIEGNILRIAPIGILTREDEEQRRLRESRELAGPVHVKTVTLSYSKARDVQSLLRTKISPRGEIIIDDRTNTLIISDVKEKIDLLEKLISVLDTPTPQVSIEARIVEATSTFIRNLGVQWGFLGISDPFYGNQTSLQFPHKILADGALIPQGIVTKGIGGPLGGYAVNLPAPAFTTAIGFSFANVLDTFRLDIALSALETSGEGRIISCPKVTTQNNQPAEIIQGRQIPVQTVANFTVTTRYVNAALELKATPQITAEGTIIMTIEIQNNAADFANLVNGIPPITTQSARTTVMIGDGGTTVIGGIYRTEDSITRERVPFFHKIPILGNLFRSFARTKQNRELLIFITPRIIK